MAILGTLTLNEIVIYEVDANPSIGGLAAPSGSLAIMTDGSGVFIKGEGGDTDWINPPDPTKVPKNSPILAGTHSKITYDANGLVTAGTNANLSEMGDVSLSSPLVDQILKYNGTNWINSSGAVVNAGPGVTYFLTNTASGIGSYEYISKTPDTGTEDDESVTVNNDTVLFHGYISDSPIGKTTIDAGIWEFNFFTYVSTLHAHFIIDVYKRSSGGTETLLFSVESSLVNWTSSELLSTTTVQPSFACSATDSLLIKVSGTTTETSNVTLHLIHSGNTNYSHFHTPLVLGHNDIAGLQGGTSGEYYHLTSSEYTGTGTGTIVRSSSPNITTPTGIVKGDVGLGNVPNVDATNRANHTGTQLADTISDFTTAVQAVTIDASKIDGGQVSNTEFSYLANVTSDIQAQIDGKRGYLGMRVITSGTTYTPTSGTTYIHATLIGGGGGGGGTTGAGGSIGAAGGGGSGSTLIIYTALTGAASYTCAIGALGAGGAAGNNPGGAGTSTTLTIGATTYTAAGGSGGTGQTAGTTVALVAGGAGGTLPTGGTININGETGFFGDRRSGAVGVSGKGGGNPYGSGGAFITGAAAAGNAATGYGAGGGGAFSNAGTNRAGGNGAPGAIIIHEYK